MENNKDFEPTTFRDFVSLDTENVFFNETEFAEIHLINDRKVPVIIENADNKELQRSFLKRFLPLDEVFEEMIVFCVKKSSLLAVPKMNSNLFFDKKLYQVADIIDDKNGVLIITIVKNTG